MPPFPSLSADEIRQLVAYIRSLSATSAIPAPIPAPNPAPNPALNPAPIPAPAPALTFERLRGAASEPHNWLTYWGDYQGTHYSPPEADHRGQRPAAAGGVGDASCRAARCSRRRRSSSTASCTRAARRARSSRSTRARDGRSGDITRPQKVRNPYRDQPVQSRRRGARQSAVRRHARRRAGGARRANRSAAVGSAGRRHDAGLQHHEPAAGREGQGHRRRRPAASSATRGFLDAYDAATGKRLWRFYTVPGPGEFGNDTWKGDSWKTGRRPDVADRLATIPSSNLVYWTGRQSGAADRSVGARRGDNLFSDSVVALDPDTGAAQVALPVHAERRPRLGLGPGHDARRSRVARPAAQAAAARRSQRASSTCSIATNGKFLVGHAVRLPELEQAASTRTAGRLSIPGSNSSPEGSFLVYPTLGGGDEFPGAVVQPDDRLVVSRVLRKPVSSTSARRRRSSRAGSTSAGPGPRRRRRGPGEPPPSAGIKAIDPETGKTMWEFPKIFQGSLTNGVLATAGGVVFAASREGNLFALDARTRRVTCGASRPARPSRRRR